MALLEVTGLRATYDRLVALDDVTVHVDQGEAVAVVGPNGAGKSTLMGAITGTVAVAAGEIAFDGKPIAGRPPEDIVRRGISIVPEGRHIFGSLSVIENLQLGTTVRRDKAEAAADIDRMLSRFEVLARLRDNPADRLSGGEQQQLAIARALLSKPRVLLLDEPSLGLSPQMIDLVFVVLEELRREGVTILLVEQNASRAMDYADRSYVLRSGRLEAERVWSGDRADQEALADDYLGLGAGKGDR